MALWRLVVSLCPRTHKGKKRLKLAIFIITLLVVLHIILRLEQEVNPSTDFSDLPVDIPVNFKPMRVTKREPLPETGDEKIPKIIHQTWKTSNVPREFVEWIKTWVEKHPDWEYWLWTDASAEELFRDKYEHLLEMFKMYPYPIQRADAMRYVLLYEFGGVYADMDMEVITPLDGLIYKYSCFIGEEPYEHSVLDSNFELLLPNAIMGCRAGHPFMKMLIDNLPMFSHMWHYLDTTGPHYVTAVYQQFKGSYPPPADDRDGLFIAPSEYFYPYVDPWKLRDMKTKCSNIETLSHLQLKACRNLKFKSLPENHVDLRTVAFTIHHWFHTYLKSDRTRFQSIFDIIPFVKMYVVEK